MGEQLALLALKTQQYDTDADRLRDVAAQLVERLGAVEVAGTLGVTAQAIHMALSGRENRAVRLDWLPALLDMDRERHLIRELCRLAGGDFVPDDKRTDAEKLAALKQEVARFGEQGVAAIRKAGL